MSKLKLSPRDKSILMIVGLAIVIVILYLLFQPFVAKVDELKVLRDTQEEKLINALNRAEKQVEMQNKYKAAAASLETNSNKYYGTTEQEYYISRLSDLIETTGARFDSVSFSDAKSAASLVSYEVELDAEGNPIVATADAVPNSFESFMNGVFLKTVDITFTATNKELLEVLKYIDGDPVLNKKPYEILSSNLTVDVNSSAENLLTFRFTDPAFDEEVAVTVLGEYNSEEPPLSCNITINFVEIPSLDSYIDKNERIDVLEEIPYERNEWPFSWKVFWMEP